MLGRFFLLAVLGGFVFCASVPPAAAYSVRKCDEIAEGDISLAADYITARLERITREFTHLSAANRDEFIRKWPRLTIVCQDEGKKGRSRTCLAAERIGGMAHSGPGNKINICYYNRVDDNETLCGLVGIIVHEAGHAHGFPAFANHNDPTQFVFDNDPVYVMGSRAQDFCENDVAHINDGPLIGRSDLALGAECRADDQCQSGHCKGGTCQCDQDGDCPGGQRCFKPATAQNYCARIDLALGAECDRNDECRSDRCQGGECVCRTDGDCPAGQVCRTPVAAQNFCERGEDGDLALGARCDRNDQCKSSRCQGGECVCRSDSDCPAGQSCYTPATRANYCQSTTLALGASCNKNSQCRSDKCQGGECRCKKDSDCPDGEVCKKPVIGNNHCERR